MEIIIRIKLIGIELNCMEFDVHLLLLYGKIVHKITKTNQSVLHK